MSLHYSRYGEKRVGKEIADVVWLFNFMNGAVRDEIGKRARSELINIFSPVKILKEMDLTSGSLNLQGVEIMRSVESNHKKYFVSIIPSSKKIKAVGKELAQYADKINPFCHFETSTGEGIEFNNVSMFNLLLHTYALLDKAKQTKISYSIATDGAKVTNNVQHCVAGIKVNDLSAKCPITGKRISPQTRNICWPLKFVMGSENQAMYEDHIKPLYRW